MMARISSIRASSASLTGSIASSGSEKNRSPKLSLTFISAAIAPASSPRLPPFHELAVPGIVQVTTLKVDDRTHVQALPVTQICRLRTAAAVEGVVDL